MEYLKGIKNYLIPQESALIQSTPISSLAFTSMDHRSNLAGLDSLRKSQQKKEGIPLKTATQLQPMTNLPAPKKTQASVKSEVLKESS